MADAVLLRLLRESGVEEWNRNRVTHPDFPQCDIYEHATWGADLAGADLSGTHLASAILIGADLREANLKGTDLSKAWLHQADMTGANLEGARLDATLLMDVILRDGNLRGASLRGVRIEGDKRRTYPSHLVVGSDLAGADLTGADLTGAHVWDSSLIGVNLTNATVTDSTVVSVQVNGISIWDLRGQPARQEQLIVTMRGARVEFSDLRAAVFFNLLQNGLALGDVVTMSGKVSVLVLGRFVGEDRKRVLSGLRESLGRLGFNPVIFDFDRPDDRDLTEMIISLASMSLFVIADLTKPRSVPLELQATIPNLMIPFVPIIQRGEEPFAMFRDLLGKHDWVLDLLEYDGVDKLQAGLKEAVVMPALDKRDQLRSRKAAVRPTRSIDDYL